MPFMPEPCAKAAATMAPHGENCYAAFVIDPDGYRIEAYCGAA